jgi:predicted lipopolysaccharide heptosyltransferase III
LRVLLIQLRRLGDLILTTPAIVALRDHAPDARIGLVVSSECEGLLPAISEVNETIVIRRNLRDLAAARRVRCGAFDCVIDFTRNDRSAWLTLLSGARRRIVSDRLKRKARLRASLYNEFVACAMKEMHTIDYNLALLQPLGICNVPAELQLQIPASAKHAAAALIADEICSDRFAIFHPGSARPEKFWEPERWAEVITFAKTELGLEPVLSSGNSAMERAHVARIRECLKTSVIDFSARLDLLMLAALVARGRMLVTVDSAPMHLAAAMKTPQVILFGPTNPFHWRPRTSPAAILFGPSTEPLRDFRAHAPKLPMNQISTAAVIDGMRSMHTAPAASAV